MSTSTDQIACKNCLFFLLLLYLNLQIYLKRKTHTQIYEHINTHKDTLIVKQKLHVTIQVSYKAFKSFFIKNVFAEKFFKFQNVLLIGLPKNR